MKKLLPLLLALLLLFSCAKAEPYSDTYYLMGTNCTVTLYGKKDAAYLPDCFSLLRDFESKISANSDSSEIAEVNKNAGLTPVVVSDVTFDLIETALALYEVTDGSFNPFLGKITSLWSEAREKEELPSFDLIEFYLPYADACYLVLDKEARSVYLRDENVALDLGGIAKGRAGDLLKAFLKEKGVKSALINLGGNIATLGSKPDGSAWVIGLQNPDAERGSWYERVEVKDESVVTSGAYERYFVLDGVLYHHIIDPETGLPASSSLLSSSIISKDGALADALSTAVFVKGAKEGMALLDKLDVKGVLATKDGEILRN